MGAPDPLQAEIDRLRRDYENLRQELYNLDASSGATLRRGVLAQAGSTAEAICKFVYRREGLEEKPRQADRMMLDELIRAFGKGDVPPERIRNHLRTVQSWRNAGSHDRGDIFEIGDDTLHVVETALSVVVRWFFNDYVGADFAQLATPVRAKPTESSDRAVDEWRELLWWVHRTTPPRTLDLQALVAKQARLGLPDDQVASLRDGMKRDLGAFVAACREAVEDGVLEGYELEALEHIRVQCCISRREAREAAGPLLKQVRVEGSAPEWLREASREVPAVASAPPPSQPGPPLPTVQLSAPPSAVAPTVSGAPAAPTTTPGFVVPDLNPLMVPPFSWPVEETLEDLVDELRTKVPSAAVRFEILDLSDATGPAWSLDIQFKPRSSQPWSSLSVSLEVGVAAEVNSPRAWLLLRSPNELGRRSTFARALYARLARPEFAALGIDSRYQLEVVAQPVASDSAAAFRSEAMVRVPQWCTLFRGAVEATFADLPPWARAIEVQDRLSVRQLRKLVCPEALADAAFVETFAFELAMEGHTEEALELGRSMPREPEFPSSRENCQALLLSVSNRDEAAWEAARPVVRLDAIVPDLDFWQHLAFLARAEEVSVELGQAILKRTPWALENALLLIRSLHALGRVGDCEAVLRAAVAAGFKRHEPLHMLAEILVGRGDWDGALALLRTDAKKNGDLYERSARRIREVLSAQRRGVRTLERPLLPRVAGDQSSKPSRGRRAAQAGAPDGQEPQPE